MSKACPSVNEGVGARRSHQRQGFSLLELMTVVTIVGVLSAVAIPTFSDYVYKARTAEATEFLGVIRLREESYRAEFGVYCASLASAASPAIVSSLDDHTNLVPNPDTTKKNAKPFVATSQWNQLGARPTGPVRFGYGVAAGSPSEVPTALGWTTANADFWFVGRAVGDLDADGEFITFEMYSATKGIWIGEGDKPIAKGWE
jgi:prepilin-type N-terminal cleavage/methylation domain-containing protein